MGSQGVGSIEAIGSGVANLHVGDRVSFWGHSYATHAILPAERLIRLPNELSFEIAAAGLNQGFIAYAFTHHAFPIKPGDWCLVQAAAGGVGLLLCQMAKIRGGRAIGAPPKETKAKFARAAAADDASASS